jgi:hypothetical protein
MRKRIIFFGYSLIFFSKIEGSYNILIRILIHILNTDLVMDPHLRYHTSTYTHADGALARQPRAYSLLRILHKSARFSPPKL